MKLRHNHLAIQLALDNYPEPDQPPVTNGDTYNQLRTLGKHEQADAFARWLLAMKAVESSRPVTRQLTEDEWWAGVALDDSTKEITGEEAAKLLDRMRRGWSDA